MLCTTPPQSVSKNMTRTSVRMRGALAESMGSNHSVSLPEINANRPMQQCGRGLSAPINLSQDRQRGFDYFLHTHLFHAAEIDRAFAQEAGTALNLMSQNNVPFAKWPG